jgi:hypothetical protein
VNAASDVDSINGSRLISPFDRPWPDAASYHKFSAISVSDKNAIDLVELDKLCMLHCTDQEIASYFGVTTERIEQERNSPQFAEVMERGKAKGKIAIRRGQMRLLEKGSSTMGVLLGRQILGQQDKVEATNQPVRVIVLPSLAPIEEDEVQIMATPNNTRNRLGS